MRSQRGKAALVRGDRKACHQLVTAVPCCFTAFPCLLHRRSLLLRRLSVPIKTVHRSPTEWLMLPSTAGRGLKPNHKNSPQAMKNDDSAATSYNDFRPPIYNITAKTLYEAGKQHGALAGERIRYTPRKLLRVSSFYGMRAHIQQAHGELRLFSALGLPRAS